MFVCRKYQLTVLVDSAVSGIAVLVFERNINISFCLTASVGNGVVVIAVKRFACGKRQCNFSVFIYRLGNINGLTVLVSNLNICGIGADIAASATA